MHTRRLTACLAVILAALTLGLAACAGPSATGSASTPTPPPAQAPGAAHPTPTTPPDTTTPPITGGASGSGYAVKVFFSRHPASENNPAVVVPVVRTSPTLGVATYALKQLIAGPTAAEQSAGYYTPLSSALTGPSSCGADFTLALNTHVNRPEQGTATLRFCRATQLPGDLSGAYITSEIQATLLQFPAIHRVVILSDTGDCFDDLSGQNLCLR